MGGWVSPLLGRFFLEGGLVKWDPSLVTIKRSPSPIQLKPIFFPCDVLGMVWPFTFDWCVLCASELVRSAFCIPCCRVLIHKTCLYSSLAISPSSPTPTCPHCQQVLGPRRFRRLCWRLSGKWSQCFECPLAPAPPHAHSYLRVYLQSMDPSRLPPPPSGDRNEDLVNGTHRLNPPTPLTPLSHSSFVIPLRCRTQHNDHHH